jgi:hypothetical protein
MKVTNFPFFLATYQDGIGGNIDGILGMARPYKTIGFENGPLLMQYMKD